MKNLQNLHTHTNYCDGKDTPEEMIQTAIDKGFDSIGFSGHSYMYFAEDHSMSVAGTEEYKREITTLKGKYEGKLDIFLGLEFELYSEVDLKGYDYLIGSSHYLKFGDRIVGFDRSAEIVKGVIDEWFGGDGMKYAKEYYKTLARLPEYGDFDILGHFDLITKHSEKHDYFDTESDEYKEYAVRAAEALAGKIPYFEVNTGAISRGYRTTPYPSMFIMKELKRLGFKPLISSDCHDRNDLDIAFEESERMLKECGFTERYILTKNGFKAVPLEG
ncbi:MAG: histidinol-phosphatase HisJ family protein [Clostridia bacterium]|nr:histidinol-phosphatase HisJ family protein [Clostridia bacterium]